MVGKSPKSNNSKLAVDQNDTLNTSKESKNSFFRAGSSFLHRIQSTHLLGPKSYNVNVQLLDDLESIEGTFKKTATGQDVLEYVCKELNIVEKEYFGLRYNDKYRYWLDLSAPLSKTFQSSNVPLSFRFRFYPNELASVKEEVTRYQLFVQLQRDLLHGRLQSNQSESARLAGLILQAEQGDYDVERHFPGYVSEFKLLLRQSERMEEKIAEFHQLFRGMSTEEAIDEFLKQCFALQTFGVNPYNVSIGKNPTDVVIGGNSSRILIFVLNQVVYDINWNFIQNLDYSGRHLKLRFKTEYFSNYLVANPELSPTAALSKVVGSTLYADDLKPEKSDKRLQLKFTCPSSTFAKHLWRDLLSQKVFFNEDNARQVKLQFSKPKIPLLTRGSTFRCPTLRVMKEIQRDPTPPREIEQHEFVRYSLPRQKPRLDDTNLSNRVTTVSIPSIKVETPTIILDENEALEAIENIEPPQYSPIEVVPPQIIEPDEQSFNQIHVDTTQNSPPTTPTIEVEIQNDDLNEQIPQLETNIQHDEKSNGTVKNGTLTNGSAVFEEKIELPVKKVKKSSLGRQIIVGILDLLVLLLLLAIVVIAVFETVGPHEPAWFHLYISNFRTHYYNQWRRLAINKYNHLFY